MFRFSVFGSLMLFSQAGFADESLSGTYTGNEGIAGVETLEVRDLGNGELFLVYENSWRGEDHAVTGCEVAAVARKGARNYAITSPRFKGKLAASAQRLELRVRSRECFLGTSEVKSFERSSRIDPITCRVMSDKAPLHTGPSAKKRSRSYLVKGDLVRAFGTEFSVDSPGPTKGGTSMTEEYERNGKSWDLDGTYFRILFVGKRTVGGLVLARDLACEDETPGVP